MNILFLTYMYPDQENPLRGIFIEKRYNVLTTLGVNIKIMKLRKNKIRYFIKRPYQLIYKPKAYRSIREKFKVITIFIKHGKELGINRVYRYIKKNKIDLIHIHGAHIGGEIAMELKKKFNVKYIVTGHGSDIHTFPFTSEKNKNYVISVFQNASHLIFVSNFLGKIAEGLGVENKKISIIPNGIDQNIFQFQIIKNNKNIYGYVGNLEYIKGADRLPEIFYEIKIAIPEASFIIIGDGCLFDQIKQDIERVDNLKDCVQFFGRLDHNSVLHNICLFSALIVPSRNEGWGCVVQEAQSKGVPVIASNVGGLPESVGAGGILVDNSINLAKDFAHAALELKNNPIPPENLIKIVKAFSWEKQCNKIFDIYRNVLSSET